MREVKYLLLIGVLVLSAKLVLSYDNFIIHPRLSEAAIKVYEGSSQSQLSSEEKSWIIEGATAEDADPRYLNHFYDPSTGAGLFPGLSTKEWAQHQSSATGDYSEDAILENYRNGNPRRAYQGVGHMLHLEQDMSVPAHTRNDPHAEGDPYEGWAEKNGVVVANEVSLISIASLDQAFTDLANYSHDNFFSKDTVGKDLSKYKKTDIFIEGAKVGFLEGEIEGQKIKFAYTEFPDYLSPIYKVDKPIISSDYWKLLSPKAIAYSAGVIEYFQNKFAEIDAEVKITPKLSLFQKTSVGLSKFKNSLAYGWGDSVMAVRARGNTATLAIEQASDPTPPPAPTAANTATSFFANAISFVTGASNTTNNSTHLIFATTKQGSGAQAAQSIPVGAPQLVVGVSVKKPAEVAAPAVQQPPVLQQSGTPVQGLNSGALPTSAQSSAENSTTREPSVKLIFIGNSSLGLGGGGGGASPSVQPQVLNSVVETPVATQEDTSVVIPKITAKLLPPSSPNLSAPQCAYSLATDGCLLATTTLRFEWPAIVGVDHYVINKNGILATTTESAIDVVAPDFSDYLFEVVAVGTDGQTSATSTQKISVATIPVAINEVAWMGTFASSTAEWLELKNNTEHTIDLGSWVLSAQDAKLLIALKGAIAPHAFYLLERANDGVITDRTADLVYGNNGTLWALNNKGETLTLSHSGAMLDQTPDSSGGAWAAGENSASVKKTMERYASKESGVDPANWGTNIGYISQDGTDAAGKPVGGTPGERNSVSYLINKGQDVTSDLTLDEGSYVVNDTVRVAASSTLTLEPGTNVLFKSVCLPRTYCEPETFEITGSINAKGTSENPIVFSATSTQSRRSVGDFVFDTTTGTSTFDHVIMRDTGTIDAHEASLEISNSEFIRPEVGVDADHSVINITNTKFFDTGDDGVYARSSSITIASSTFDGIGCDPITAVEGSSLVVSSTTIAHSDYSWVGIGVFSSSTASLDSVTVIDGGIAAIDSSLSITDSAIKNETTTFGIALQKSTTTIANTLVQGLSDNMWQPVGIVAAGGSTDISSSTVTGFSSGTGVRFEDHKTSTMDENGNYVEIVVPPLGTITGSEISGNAIGVSIPQDGVIVTDVLLHDNKEDVVVVPPPPPPEPPIE